ncbi:sulfotransferase domain-containing protein [Mesobacterium pallidum]|uniref:sulfotransferase domain-containing protein n=1 Tax=Mesobacterium pallidum TaxID=2872037 RepID=UPI001EE1D22C|nr:sulfotransferase domain-containing protein [Mesobacterium pallidum]
MSNIQTRMFRGVPLEMAVGSRGDICIVLGIRKSGSSIFNSICTALARFNDVPYVDVGGTLFKAGQPEHAWLDDPSIAEILEPGNLYGGFRSFPAGLARTPQFRAARKVCMVRDPRDALVSEYFSNAYSHSLPEEGEARAQMEVQRTAALNSDIAEYIGKRIHPMAQTCAPFVAAAKDPLMKVFRYEDVIFEKPRLMREVCDHMHWTVTDHQVELIMGWADVRPASERPGEFVRRVAPGDYENKMSPELQARVGAELAPFMTTFGYA